MDESEHRRAFERLPDKLSEQVEDSGHGMLSPKEPWTPPEGEIVLERVPPFENGLDLGDYLTHRIRTNVRWSVVSHSPSGYEWGYSGSGPADLSLNLLNMFVPPRADGREPVACYEGEASATAWELHQEFKQAVLAAGSRGRVRRFRAAAYRAGSSPSPTTKVSSSLTPTVTQPRTCTALT